MNSCWFRLTDSDSAKILNQTRLETHSSRSSDTKPHKNTCEELEWWGSFHTWTASLRSGTHDGMKFAIFPLVSALCSQRTSKAHNLTGISLHAYVADSCGGGCALLRWASSWQRQQQQNDSQSCRGAAWRREHTWCWTPHRKTLTRDYKFNAMITKMSRDYKIAVNKWKGGALIALSNSEDSKT